MNNTLPGMPPPTQDAASAPPSGTSPAPEDQPIIPLPMESCSAGWWQHNWKWAVPIGAAVCIVGFVVTLFAVIIGVARSTEVYQTAVLEARSDPSVVAAIGTPISEALLFTGSIEVSGPSGSAEIDIPISGPLGAGYIRVDATRADGDWYYTMLAVEFANGHPAVDLMRDW